MTAYKPSGFVASTSQRRHEDVTIQRHVPGAHARASDTLPVEEPLEIRLAGNNFEEQVPAITMRTPGQDDELALGFLFSEGVIRNAADVIDLAHCRPPAEGGFHNSIRVTLAAHNTFDPAAIERRFHTTSACGVCGRTSIDGVVDRQFAPLTDGFSMTQSALMQLPGQLRERQAEFSRTGGIHAAGLVDATGAITIVREDIGRHNAVDKVIGACLLQDLIPLSSHALLLSGRAGFELVQKAVTAGIECVASIGAPSSLSAQLAEESGLTLAGFVSEAGFNMYSHPRRVLR